jgi:hypothetical protein
MKSVTVRALGIAALVTLAAQDGFVHAQAQKGNPPLRLNFRALTDEGQQVGDLKADELTLKINGKPRPILSLSMSQSAPGGANEPHADLPIPYATNTVGTSGRVFYVLVDNDSIAPGREGQLKEAVHQLASELGPGDAIGLLSTQGEVNIMPTDDVRKVTIAVDQMGGRGPTSETASDAQCRTVHIMRDLGTMISLGSATPTTLVVFSGGLTMPETKIVNIGQRNRTALGGSSAPSSATTDECPVRPEDFTNLGTLAATADVDLYVFQLTDVMPTRSTTQDAGIESLAGATAGEFTRVGGSPQQAMARMLRETSTYYTLTFAPDASDHPGQMLRVELKSTRDKVKVRARPGVDLPKVNAAKSVSPQNMLRTAAEYRDLPLRTAAYPAPTVGSDDVTVVAVFESIDSAPLASASVGLFDEKNTLKKQWTAKPDELAKRPTMAALTATPGTYRVRVAAIDGSGRTGTADYELDAQVPRADPLKLSALVIGTQAAGGFMPRLDFKDAAVAIGMVQIYGVPKGANLKMDLDVAPTADGAALATADTTIAPARAEDQRVAFGGFSIDSLPPGDYLMRAVVSLDGKPVGKVVRTLRKSK